MTDKRTRAIVTVGDGRGFIVEGPLGRVVITAAHCLPHLPPAHAAAYTGEKTYADLLGPLGEKPTIWAECLFVDPVSDLAIMGTPDNQELYQQADAYDTLVASGALKIASAPRTSRAWLFSLDGKWFPCVLHAHPMALDITKAASGIMRGMSGSPIVNNSGAAVGVVCVASGADLRDCREGGPNPRLVGNLPGWLTPRVGARKAHLRHTKAV